MLQYLLKPMHEIMEETALLFSRFPNINLDLKIDVHQVLKKMILYRFQDDLDKAEELLCLITTNFTNEEVDKMNSYEREIYAKDQEITKKVQEITKKDQEITKKVQEITKKDQEITKKDEEISKLTEELNNLKNNKKSS